MTTQDELARELIDLTRLAVGAEAVLLQRRIDATLGYMASVTAPSPYTLEHVRGFLTGERDWHLDGWIERHNERLTMAVRWNTDKPHRCPGCHAVAVDMERPKPWRTYTCCRCGVRFTRWPRLAWLLPDAGVMCSEHRES